MIDRDPNELGNFCLTSLFWSVSGEHAFLPRTAAQHGNVPMRKPATSSSQLKQLTKSFSKLSRFRCGIDIDFAGLHIAHSRTFLFRLSRLSALTVAAAITRSEIALDQLKLSHCPDPRVTRTQHYTTATNCVQENHRGARRFEWYGPSATEALVLYL